MKPLTIEQLKALSVGDWVWVTTGDGKYGAYGRVCQKFDDDNFRVETIESYLVDPYETYGTKWLVYKNKEQAEAKGEIVELPCKIGDTVWYIEYGYCYPNLKSKMEVKPIIVTEISWKRNRSGKDLGFALIANGTRYKFSSFGKTVFFTKSEAERRLAELKGEKT